MTFRNSHKSLFLEHFIHVMRGEDGEVSENQYQTKIRNGGAFLGAILIFAGLSWLMGSF